MGEKPTISVRVYKGSKMSFDAKGNAQNENQSIKYVHDTVEWANFLKNISANGYCKVEVESVKVIEKVKENNFFVDKVSDYENIDAIKKEVEIAFKNQTEEKLTPEQQKIADLEAKLNALLGKKEEVVEEKPKKVKQETSNPEDIEVLREEYKKAFGKKPFAGWGSDILKEKMAELQN